MGRCVMPRMDGLNCSNRCASRNCRTASQSSCARLDLSGGHLKGKRPGRRGCLTKPPDFERLRFDTGDVHLSGDIPKWTATDLFRRAVAWSGLRPRSQSNARSRRRDGCLPGRGAGTRRRETVLVVGNANSPGLRSKQKQPAGRPGNVNLATYIPDIPRMQPFHHGRSDPGVITALENPYAQIRIYERGNARSRRGTIE